MITSKSTLLLFAVIILEGYVVLSSELLAIRLATPFTGNGTETVSIIIAAVLMPLAFGYHTGGHFRPGWQQNIFGRRYYMSIRGKLVFNMVVALLFLLFGLSYNFLNSSFSTLINLGLTNRLILTSLYAGLLIAPPVYLLGQTIPLASNFFSKERLSKLTGKILFLSTLGSFAGAVFSTLVLMSMLGVHNTAIINFVILGILITALSTPVISQKTAIIWALIVIGFIANSDAAMLQRGIIKNNQYNTIAVFNVNGERHLYMNGNPSSMYTDNGRKYSYIEFIERIGIGPIWNGDEPKDILVIGAGGFTLGHEDHTNRYDYVDIDKDLQDIAEEQILKEPIGKNKTFHPLPARAFLTKETKKYDLIVIDAYLGRMSMPEHLVTLEFFEQIKAHLKENGKVMANMAISPNFLSAYSRHIDNTLQRVFPHVSRHVIGDYYALWETNENIIANVIYMYIHRKEANADQIYSDKKNRIFLDKPRGR